jgi:hypothetical protein
MASVDEQPTPVPDTKRRRERVAGCLVATIALGLLSRCWPLPGLLAEYTGDALYATAVFFALAALWPAASGARLAAAAWSCAALVEVSQLASWPWLVALRSTRAGALVLGQGFQWADLLAYAAGAAFAWVADAALRRCR